MRSPDALAETLRRRWREADRRVALFRPDAVWPLELSIGRVSPATFADHTAQVRAHLEQWRSVNVGEVLWEAVRFRAGGEAVQLPTHWRLRDLDEFVAASADPALAAECMRIKRFLALMHGMFHEWLIRHRAVWREQDDADVIRAGALALEASPGMAQGVSLRNLAFAGVDSKFIERNEALLRGLLDVRYEGRATAEGLVGFLGAADLAVHWLLVVPLCPGLLPFAQLRVRAHELRDTALPGSRILLVENERSLHQLPLRADTVAILGAGLDLNWLAGDWLRERSVAYWGDLDTWGLSMLAKARTLLPHVQPLLMTREIFDAYAPQWAVPEPTHAGDEPPPGLSAPEQELYRWLRSQARGRLEQERLPSALVADALANWCG